jgi:hypothetical protein
MFFHIAKFQWLPFNLQAILSTSNLQTIFLSIIVTRQVHFFVPTLDFSCTVMDDLSFLLEYHMDYVLLRVFVFSIAICIYVIDTRVLVPIFQLIDILFIFVLTVSFCTRNYISVLLLIVIHFECRIVELVDCVYIRMDIQFLESVLIAIYSICFGCNWFHLQGSPLNEQILSWSRTIVIWKSYSLFVSTWFWVDTTLFLTQRDCATNLYTDKVLTSMCVCVCRLRHR